ARWAPARWAPARWALARSALARWVREFVPRPRRPAHTRARETCLDGAWPGCARPRDRSGKIFAQPLALCGRPVATRAGVVRPPATPGCGLSAGASRTGTVLR